MLYSLSPKPAAGSPGLHLTTPFFTLRAGTETKLCRMLGTFTDYSCFLHIMPNSRSGRCSACLEWGQDLAHQG
ncbi:unnamed protein product [Ectocarpus sp. CCAP 1310/34]|nr:unnamed protein product [Ectocarpus sp. CCAP 1310/34]